MSQDAYGFQSDAAPAAEASLAMWMGVAASMLASVGVCFCYMPYFLALPLGIYAVVKGAQAQSSPSADGRAMAYAGMVAGGLSALISSMFVLFILVYVAFLMVMVVAGIAGGNGEF